MDALSKSVDKTLRMLCEWGNIEILEINIKKDHLDFKTKK